MVKALFIGDPHFQVENVRDVEIFIAKTCELVSQEKLDFVCILGDMLHTHEKLHSVPMNKAIEFVTLLSTLVPSVIVLVGNHDMYSNQEFLNTNHWMNCLKTIPRVDVIDRVVMKTWNSSCLPGPVSIVFAPFVYEGRFEEALNTCDGWKSSCCIVAHQEFYNCKMGAVTSVKGDVWNEHYPPVISGHIHENQTVHPNIYYPGSALQHSFGDTGKNIVALVSFPGDGQGRYTLSEIDLGLPRKKIIYSNVKDQIEIPKIKDGEKIRLTVSGKQDEFKAFKKSEKFKKLIGAGIKVVFRPEKIDVLLQKDKSSSSASDVLEFDRILKSLVDKANCKHVSSAYDFVSQKK